MTMATTRSSAKLALMVEFPLLRQYAQDEVRGWQNAPGLRRNCWMRTTRGLQWPRTRCSLHLGDLETMHELCTHATISQKKMLVRVLPARFDSFRNRLEGLAGSIGSRPRHSLCPTGPLRSGVSGKAENKATDLELTPYWPCFRSKPGLCDSSVSEVGCV